MALLHILASGWDQFVSNILLGQGALHQVLRDLGLMIPDLLHLVLPWYELRRLARSKGISARDAFTKQELTAAFTGTLVLWLVITLMP